MSDIFQSVAAHFFDSIMTKMIPLNSDTRKRIPKNEECLFYDENEMGFYISKKWAELGLAALGVTHYQESYKLARWGIKLNGN